MKRSIRGVAALVAATLAMMGGNVLAQNNDQAGKTALVSERDKVSYAVGLDVGKSFQPVAEFLDLVTFERAVRNAFDGGKALLTEEENGNRENGEVQR